MEFEKVVPKTCLSREVLGIENEAVKYGTVLLPEGGPQGKKILSAVPLFVKVIVIASRYFSTTRIVFRTKQQLQSEVQQNNSNTYCCGKFPTNRD